MAKAKKAFTATPEEAEKIQANITALENQKSHFVKQKEDFEKRFPSIKDANGNVVRKGPARRIEILEEMIKQIDARLAEFQASLTA